MIDTLRTLAQPFSHWLMAHRDVTIIVMGLFLMWTTGQALLSRWRNQRLDRDLAATRGDSRSVVRRSYAPAGVPPSKAAPAEAESTTGLPPIKGGRTYARNLGNALQKAGMGPAPVYSPPTPTGWGPGPVPSPGRPTPAAPPTYTVPAPPWASPAQPVPPSGPRPMPASAPAGPWPTYVPPGGPGHPGTQSPQMAPPPYGAPGQFGPAVAQPQFPHPAPYAMPAPAAPPAPAPPSPFAGVPLSEPVPPPLPTFAPPSAQAVSPPVAPPKPKRKRFSLQVLQNLEKTLQRTTGMGASAPVVEPPAPPAITPPAEVPAPRLATAAPAPVAEPSAPEAPAIEEPEVPAPQAEEIAEVPQPEEPAWKEPEHAESKEPEIPAWQETEAPASDTRAAMRAMLFGEGEKATSKRVTKEPAPVQEAKPEVEEEVFRFEPVSAEPAAPGQEPAAEEMTPVEAAAEPSEVPAEVSEPVSAPWQVESPEATEPSEPAAAEAGTDTAASVPEATLFEPQATSPYSAPPETSTAAGGGDRGKIVIIEDDTGVAEYYATLFRGNGFEVHVASDGISGVDLCTRVQPNMILLDVMMPRQNGMLVLQTLRASDETRETPVVVLSNFSEPTLIKRALQLGALEYVIKTQVEGAALLDAMPRWMNREKVFAAA